MVIAFPAYGACKHCSSTTVTFADEDWMECAECGETGMSWFDYKERMQAHMDRPRKSEAVAFGLGVLRFLKSGNLL
jgi:hypothetical protein